MGRGALGKTAALSYDTIHVLYQMYMCTAVDYIDNGTADSSGGTAKKGAAVPYHDNM